MLPNHDAVLGRGGEVKTLDDAPQGLKVGGYCILFGRPEEADFVGDVFTPETDFGLDLSTKGRFRWQHGLDPAIGRTVLGLCEFKAEPDDVGVWAEGWIKQDEPWKKKLAEWIVARELGFSTGTAANCVGKEPYPGGKAFRITEWPLGADVSLTRTPCDPRQRWPQGSVMPLKAWAALLDESAPEAAAGAVAGTLWDRYGGSVADLAELVPLVLKSADHRREARRELSPERIAVLQAGCLGLTRLLVAVGAPLPEETPDLRRRGEATRATLRRLRE